MFGLTMFGGAVFGLAVIQGTTLFVMSGQRMFTVKVTFGLAPLHRAPLFVMSGQRMSSSGLRAIRVSGCGASARIPGCGLPACLVGSRVPARTGGCRVSRRIPAWMTACRAANGTA
jgi:hypothetical protein